MYRNCVLFFSVLMWSPAPLLRRILYNYKLSGSLPSEIGLLTTLTYLYHLTSTIVALFSPSAFSACSAPPISLKLFVVSTLLIIVFRFYLHNFLYSKRF